MILKVLTRKTTAVLNAENIVFYSKDNKKNFLEVSCCNMDAYRFEFSMANFSRPSDAAKDIEKFAKACKNAVDAQFDGREKFVLSLLEWDVKFEKSSLSSHID